jgi:DNA-binding NarL/FixJ family response regulator
MKPASGVETGDVGEARVTAGESRPAPEQAPGRERLEPQIQAFSQRHGLSGRQQQILLLIALGLHPKAVAAALSFEYSTVRTHIRRMCTKVGCADLRELIIRLFMHT